MSEGWTFLSNHGHVLLAVSQDPDSRVTDLAARVGISTRATLSILDDLERAGYVRRTKEGRRTHYTVCLLYTSPSPRDKRQSRMPSSA